MQRDGADTVAAADRWLDTLPSSRFFLFLHFYEPHTPYSPPARSASTTRTTARLPTTTNLSAVSPVASARTAPAVSRTQRSIVLLSDHGEGLGDHGEHEHGLFLYRDTMPDPFDASSIHSNGGGRTGAPIPVQRVNLVPTMLDVLKLPKQPGLLGRSRSLPLLDGGTIQEQGLYAEALLPSRYHFGWSELYSLTDTQYSFIRAPRHTELLQRPGRRNSQAVRGSSRPNETRRAPGDARSAGNA